MLNPAELVRENALVAPAIAAAASDGAAVVAALASVHGDARDAALAIAAGLAGVEAAQPALIALLDRDDLAGTAAAWALAQLNSEAAVLAAISAGGIDIRTNGYASLTRRAALGRASASLADALVARVEDENTRARAKRTGLGDQALRGLAVLGDARCADLIQQVQDADPYTDKFELQRLRKAVSDGGRDSETISEQKQDWTETFAAHIAAEAPPAEPAAAAPAKPAVATPSQAAPDAADVADAEMDDALDTDPTDPGGEDAMPAPKPIDWKAFAASPEALALPDQVRGLAVQLGPLLEQLAARAIGAGLADLTGQELAALLLQVMPQALPPQHVQAALSPQALHGYQAIAKHLAAIGVASHGEDLLAGIGMVREALKAQMRRAGILNGPDYSDPDAATPAKPVVTP